ncbi:MAG: hypothetical protein ISQ08_04970 [Planctomycetes bacterium]|nr:hypothetical protein [Planctomycetota bacterium]
MRSGPGEPPSGAPSGAAREGACPPEGDLWLRELTDDGSHTLVDPDGRACHSLAGAWSQARERYVAGVDLAARQRGGRVRLLDVGTGLGLNLAAALEACTRAGLALEVVALEASRVPLELAARAPEPVAQPWHGSVVQALENALGEGSSSAGSEAARAGWVPLGEKGRLRLLLGDARVLLPAYEPAWQCDAVFLDPFAPSEDPGLWDASFLAAVAARMAPGARLATYCAAVAPRVALMAAGLEVGRLGRVGRKSEGTVASRGPASLEPLPPRLARRLARRAEELRSGPPGLGAPASGRV